MKIKRWMIVLAFCTVGLAVFVVWRTDVHAERSFPEWSQHHVADAWRTVAPSLRGETDDMVIATTIAITTRPHEPLIQRLLKDLRTSAQPDRYRQACNHEMAPAYLELIYDVDPSLGHHIETPNGFTKRWLAPDEKHRLQMTYASALTLVDQAERLFPPEVTQSDVCGHQHRPMLVRALRRVL